MSSSEAGPTQDIDEPPISLAYAGALAVVTGGFTIASVEDTSLHEITAVHAQGLELGVSLLIAGIGLVAAHAWQRWQARETVPLPKWGDA